MILQTDARYDEYLDKMAREQSGDHGDAKEPCAACFTDDQEGGQAAAYHTRGGDCATDIVRLVDVGVKIERLSRGESTENKQISGE